MGEAAIPDNKKGEFTDAMNILSYTNTIPPMLLRGLAFHKVDA